MPPNPKAPGPPAILPNSFQAFVTVVSGPSPADLLATDPTRGSALVKNLGPLSVWIGARDIDLNLLGYRLRVGEVESFESSAGLYALTFTGQSTLVAVLDASTA